MEIESIFEKWHGIARAEGLLTDKDAAEGIVQSIDQVNTNHYIWNKHVIFPTRKPPYEQYEFSVPAEPEAVCQGCHQGSPYIPNDIVGHDHFARKLLADPHILQILEEFVEAQPVKPND